MTATDAAWQDTGSMTGTGLVWGLYSILPAWRAEACWRQIHTSQYSN